MYLDIVLTFIHSISIGFKKHEAQAFNEKTLGSALTRPSSSKVNACPQSRWIKMSGYWAEYCNVRVPEVVNG